MRVGEKLNGQRDFLFKKAADWYNETAMIETYAELLDVHASLLQLRSFLIF